MLSRDFVPITQECAEPTSISKPPRPVDWGGKSPLHAHGSVRWGWRAGADGRRFVAEQIGKDGLLTALLTDCLRPAGSPVGFACKIRLVGEEGLEPSKP